MTMTRLLRLLLLPFAIALALSSPAEAQFETPNRQFHNQTGFPLEGRHRDVACTSCHINSVYKGTPTRCYDCHWERRQDDRFRLQLGSQCEACHRPVSWTAVRFDHGASTGMPLNGAHRQIACQSCHQNNNFQTANTTCISCHQQDYQSAQTPNHLAAGFPTTCEACHRPSDTTFNQATFDHQASFALVGAHAQTTCATCHRNNVFRGTARDCVGCHRTEYERTSSPNHAAAGFPTTCESCHRETDPGWRGSGTGFNHASVFALVGQHAQQQCVTCHRNNVYRGTAHDCVGCHQEQYNRTTAPAHAAAGFPTTCESCHQASASSWGGGGFNHASVFALQGPARAGGVPTCHRNNVYRGTARDCVGCHQEHTTAPRRPRMPRRVSTTCESCHQASASSWSGGGSTTPASSRCRRHAQVARTCHPTTFIAAPAQLRGLSPGPAYSRTSNPPHASSGFPRPARAATAQRTRRGTRLRSTTGSRSVGPHRQSCNTCHQTSTATFTCLVCHDHSQSEMDSKHRGRAGYRYDSLACYSCHPQGRH
jgi:hypothetical protein